jgi:uncharacterized protein (TIGR04255 family)
MPYPHLANAPIVEALIDLRFEPEFAGVDEIRPIREQLRPRFPSERALHVLEGKLSLPGAGQPAAIEPAVGRAVGYSIWSLDERRAAQLRTNGFSFSRLKPYGTWAEMRDEARTIWELVSGALSHRQIVRAAVRYINRIELPLPFVGHFEDYFRTFPMLAPDMPQGLAGFYSRLVVPAPPATIILTQASDAPGETLPIIFDIDVFVQSRFEVLGDEVWNQLDKLRDLKNDAFFKSATPKLLELFR